MEPIKQIEVVMAMPRDQLKRNIERNNASRRPRVEHLLEFRDRVPLAIVGGGPSLNRTFRELRSFRYVMACGSVHDHLIQLGIEPGWVVVSDPDPIMALYLKMEPSIQTKYLVASHCSKEIFDVLNGREVYLWNCGEGESSDLFGEKALVFGGGCTVVTRAFNMALCFGFGNLHFFGVDNCVPSEEEHHAYAFQTPDEKVGEICKIAVREGGPMFKMPGYLLGQLLDLRTIIGNHPRTMITVHGGGAFAALMEEADRRRREGHGEERRLNGSRDAVPACGADGN